MEYCSFQSCRPVYSTSLEGLASAALIQTIVKLDRNSPKFERLISQVLHFAKFLRRDFAYTVLLKRSVFEIRDVEEEFRYYKIELINVSFIYLVRTVCSLYIKKIIFVNNKDGLASLTCKKHFKSVPSLDFFLWTNSVGL